MPLLLRAIVFGALVTTLNVAEAQTRSKLLDATDPERIASTIQDLGYRARLETADDANPVIFSSVGGTEFAIYFNTCDNGFTQCRVLLFKAGYDLDDGTTLDVIEAFNERTLIGRVYLDDENDPWLEFAVNMYGGVTRKNFEDTFDWWEIIVAEFEDHIGF